jgi:hypothetical protein
MLHQRRSCQLFLAAVGSRTAHSCRARIYRTYILPDWSHAFGELVEQYALNTHLLLLLLCCRDGHLDRGTTYVAVSLTLRVGLDSEDGVCSCFKQASARRRCAILIKRR